MKTLCSRETLYGNELMSLADIKIYEGFRQVHDIHKYFAEIKCSCNLLCMPHLSPLCRFSDGGGFRSWPKLFAVLDDFFLQFCGF